MADLLTHWKLRERPFEATWDTRFFFQSPRHEEALNRLAFLAAERTMNMGMLTGEIGCGKTMTRAVFAKSLPESQFRVVTQENSAFTFRDLLRAVLHALEPGNGPPPTGKAALFRRLETVAGRLSGENRHLVLIFDEAQEMSPSALNELKLLTNLNADGRSCLTLILVGQPELQALVTRLPATNQRISLRFHLGPLGAAEVADYLRHRLRMAGHETGELFSADAVERLFHSSQGIPRQINRLAKLAIEYAWLRGLDRVSPDAVSLIVRDLERQQFLPFG
jgi:general secretion pathway protein A